MRQFRFHRRVVLIVLDELQNTLESLPPVGDESAGTAAADVDGFFVRLDRTVYGKIDCPGHVTFFPSGAS